jgi:hypothetical protein
VEPRLISLRPHLKRHLINLCTELRDRHRIVRRHLRLHELFGHLLRLCHDLRHEPKLLLNELLCLRNHTGLLLGFRHQRTFFRHRANCTM